MKPADCKIPPSGKVNDFVQDPLKLRLRTHAQDTIVIVVPRTVEPRLRIQAQDTMMTVVVVVVVVVVNTTQDPVKSLTTQFNKGKQRERNYG